MDAAILFSHGSLLCGAGEALEVHAERLRRSGKWPIVAVGYLNYSEPDFASTVAQCAQAGASTITVIPYFLIPGYFVSHSLPEQIESVRSKFPNLEFRISPPLGFDARLADAILESAASPLPADGWREDLARAAKSCRVNPQCPLYGTPGCPGQPNPFHGLAELAGKPIHEMERRRKPSTVQKGKCTTRSLLVMVHGTPRPQSNAQMFEVVEEVRRRGVYEVVEVGFMECNEPSIPDAIERCIALGADSVVAVPYFLHTGKHVADDLPGLIEEAQALHPGVEFAMGRYIGASPRLSEILMDRGMTVED